MILCKEFKIRFLHHVSERTVQNTNLNVSAELPESAVLDGFVPLSKLNAFGLSECGEAVVELAIHSLESLMVFWMVLCVDAVVEDV